MKFTEKREIQTGRLRERHTSRERKKNKERERERERERENTSKLMERNQRKYFVDLKSN